MKITYTPKGEASRTWNVDLDDLPVAHGEVIENRMTGDVKTYEAFKQLITVGQARATRVLLWYLQWLDHPTLRFEQVDFRMSEVQVEFEEYELRARLDALREAKPRGEEQVAAVEQGIAVIEAEFERNGWDSSPKGKADPKAKA